MGTTSISRAGRLPELSNGHRDQDRQPYLRATGITSFLMNKALLKHSGSSLGGVRTRKYPPNSWRNSRSSPLCEACADVIEPGECRRRSRIAGEVAKRHPRRVDHVAYRLRSDEGRCMHGLVMTQRGCKKCIDFGHCQLYRVRPHHVGDPLHFRHAVPPVSHQVIIGNDRSM